jgi:zinc-binding alcohol dehydrogenase/oxidoreductase
VFTKGKVGAGTRVLITGIGGGVAVAALQFAVAAGAYVVVTSSSPGKLQRAAELGASAGYLYNDAAHSWSKRLLSEEGMLDVVVDGAGGDTLTDLLSVLVPGGSLVSYGSTTKPSGSLLLPYLFLKQITLHGTSMGSEREFEDMLAFVEKHRIVPVVSATLSLSRVHDAFSLLASGSQFGKVVLHNQEVAESSSHAIDHTLTHSRL